MAIINRERFNSTAGMVYSYVQHDEFSEPHSVAIMVADEIIEDGNAVYDFTTEQDAMTFIESSITADKENALDTVFEKLVKKYGSDRISYGDGCISITLGDTKFNFHIAYDLDYYTDLRMFVDVTDEEREINIEEEWHVWDYRKVSNFIRKHNK